MLLVSIMTLNLLLFTISKILLMNLNFLIKYYNTVIDLKLCNVKWDTSILLKINRNIHKFDSFSKHMRVIIQAVFCVNCKKLSFYHFEVFLKLSAVKKKKGFIIY